jgi:excisionase family DNA binding protein
VRRNDPIGLWPVLGVGPHDRPVRTARSRVTAALSLTPLPPSWPDDHSVQSGPAQHPGPPHERGCPVATQPSGKAVPDPPSYLHPAEVADILHVSPKTVARWAKEGRLPFLKTLGGHRRYPEAEIRQLANELQVQPTT